MSRPRQRRETEVFSLSFLDCICCGFGAIILIFILSVAQKRTIDRISVEELADRLRRMETQVSISKQEIERLTKLLTAAQSELPALKQKTADTQLKLTDRKRELLALLQQTGLIKEALASLMDKKKALPTVEQAPLPIPDVDRRQYLTGFRLEGECVLFLVRASGSMLGETVEDATERLDEADYKKREAPKWQRTIRSLEWMLATLAPETRFQILLFSDDASPILPKRADEWFALSDKKAIAEIVTRLNQYVPAGSANLERAFVKIRTLSRLPDAIVLITDGLPTSSDSYLSDGPTTDEQRVRFFREAVRNLPERIPVSTVLMPMSGDPAAPALYWELANRTRGALISPSKNWPES
ncbi:MAG: hypothetical protein JNN01_03300 [Opitutaceae bacterium]|nr:hypothetical protein [Opitutaceae bacterium]